MNWDNNIIKYKKERHKNIERSIKSVVGCRSMRRNDDKFQSFLSMERQGLLLAGIALKTVRDKKKAQKESQSVEKEDK